MVVTTTNFPEVVKHLSKAGTYGLDTETTGLTQKDRLFSIILADRDDAYYFNFNDRADHLGGRAPQGALLSRTHLEGMAEILENTDSLFGPHNAKFDLGMLAKEGLNVLGTVHCTEAMERVVQNNIIGHKPYSLASCAARRGLKKDDRVDAYLKEHGLIEKIHVPGKEKAFELKFFHLVPFALMSEYAQQDARLHLTIMLDQIAKISMIENGAPSQAPKLWPLVDNERRLTKTCLRMEQVGIKIDRTYTKKAMKHAEGQADQSRKEYLKLTGLGFDDSAVHIKEVFEKNGIVLPKTKTGKPCTNKQVLDALDNPIADKIREIRTREKLISTYYSSFLYFADENDVIHPNMRQAGTETTRFSYSDPNLQNVPKEDEEEDRLKKFIVRKCFVPRVDFCFVPIDFKQQEFKMLADYAGARDIIEACNAGMDFHEATAKLLGITRKQAKTINFGLLYGMGAAKLAASLGVNLEEAHRLRALYFAKLPTIQSFIRGVIKTGEARRYVWGWHGNRCHISSPDFAYVLPNHIIQGGCAQVLRIGMVKLDEHIRTRKLRSRMILQVHDELLFEVHKSELGEVAGFKTIMESAYRPRNGILLDCSVEHSWDSWGKWDQKKGAPA